MIGQNHTISTKRLIATTGKEAYSVGFIIANEPAFIEKMNPEDAAMWSGANSLSMYLMHLDGTPDVRKSDKVIDDAGNEYIVHDIQPFTGGDIPDHSEIVLSGRAKFV